MASPDKIYEPTRKQNNEPDDIDLLHRIDGGDRDRTSRMGVDTDAMVNQLELFDAMCPVCSLWFCDDQKCKKQLHNAEYQLRYRQTHDRREYFRARYRANRRAEHPRRAVLVTINGETARYAGIAHAARALGCHKHTIRNYCKGKTSPRSMWVEFEDSLSRETVNEAHTDELSPSISHGI